MPAQSKALRAGSNLPSGPAAVDLPPATPYIRPSTVGAATVEGPVRVVAFDLDDTLYPEGDFAIGALAAAGNALDDLLGRPTGAAGVFLDVLADQGPFHVFDAGLARLGIPRTPDVIARLVAAFRNHDPVLRPFDGVAGMLADLRGRGARLALVTDGPPDLQRRKWAVLGLSKAFEVAVFTGDVGGRPYPKPDPEAFREVERRTGCAGRAIVFAGNHPAKDFPAPDLLGWRTVRARFPGGFHKSDPDAPGRLEAASIGQLHEILLGML